MPSVRGATLAIVVVAAAAGCSSHDPATELAVSGVETYWIVDTPQQGQNYVAPAVRFHLKNVGPRTLGSVQARARFPAPPAREDTATQRPRVSRRNPGPGCAQRLALPKPGGRGQPVRSITFQT